MNPSLRKRRRQCWRVSPARASCVPSECDAVPFGRSVRMASERLYSTRRKHTHVVSGQPTHTRCRRSKTIIIIISFQCRSQLHIFWREIHCSVKERWGTRPITVGYTLRRLISKCANNYVITKRSKALQPQQLGVGVSGGAEAAVHAMRRLVNNLPANHVIVKLDFSNAFNCIRRDLILDTTATHTPEIYRLVYSAYSSEPILTFGRYEILSSEGAQQGDPLGSLEFCEAMHPLLMSLRSSVKIGFVDDVTLSGDLQTVE